MADGDRQSVKSKRFPFWVIALCALMIWVVWGVGVVLAFTQEALWPWAELVEVDGLSKAGQFGDLFGGVNALFSAFAFAFLGWTAWVQAEQLKDQRQALADQRADIIEDQRIARTQILESRFFSQISTFRMIADRFKASKARANPPDDPWKATALLAAEIISKAAKQTDNLDEFRDILVNEYVSAYSGDHRRAIEPYLHSLYYLIRPIHEASDPKVDRKSYVDIVRGLLDSDELNLVALIAVASTETEFGVVAYVPQYVLLKHFPAGPARRLLERCLPEGSFHSPRIANAPAAGG